MQARVTLDSTAGNLSSIAISGDLDLAVEQSLVEQVEAALQRSEGTVTLDLAGVEFIDSSGVRSLMRLHQAHQGRVALGPVSPAVLRVLTIAGLLELFGIDRPPAE